ncbi:MAG TPA: TIR domain-containing protein [Thermoanaerobaculia bacterium]
MAATFISYSHDSTTHRERVTALANRLRADGVDCMIDRFVWPFPEDGWSGWMTRSLREARYVLVVCTETYTRRFHGDEEPGKGMGATWEGAIITKALYAAYGRNRRFIPVVFGASGTTPVPDVLSDATRFDVTSEAHYIDLLRVLTDQREIVPVPVAPNVRELPPRSLDELLHNSTTPREQRCPIPKPFPRMQRSFVDRDTQRAELKERLEGDEASFLCVSGPGGFGKSKLVHWLLNDVAPNARIASSRLSGIAYLECVPHKTTLDDIRDLLGRTTNQSARLRELFASELSITAKIEQLLSAVSDAGTAWLVLDDLQNILDSDGTPVSADVLAFFNAVVSTAHSLRIISTTRVAPRLTEAGMTVIPLSEGLPVEEAIAFLRREGKSVGLDRADDAMLRDAVRRVHAVPKALETIIGFISDRYPSMTLQQLLADPARFAAFEQYDSEHGLRALIAEQFAGQPEGARRILTALAVFAMPVPVDALRHVLPEIDCDRQLTPLFKNHLVSFDADCCDTHPVVREAAAKAEPLATLHERAAKWFMSIAKPVAESRTLADVEPRLQAFHHLVEAGQHDRACDLLNEVQRKQLTNWGEYARVLALRARLRPTQPRLQALDLFYRGMPLIRLGRISEALGALHESMELAAKRSDMKLVSRCANTIAVAYFNRLEIDAAVRWYKHSMELRAKAGLRTMVGLGNLGEAYQLVGEYDLADTSNAEAYAYAQAHGERRYSGSYLADRANIMAARGEMDGAIDTLRTSVAIAQEFGDRLREGIRWGSLSIMFLSRGEYDDALRFAQQSLGIFDDLGAVGKLVSQQTNVGTLHWLRSEHREAEIAYRKASDVHTEGNHSYAAQIMLGALTGDRAALYRGLRGCENLLAKTPRFVEARYRYAFGLLARKDPRAEAEYRNALQVCALPGIVAVQERVRGLLMGSSP